MMCPDLTVPEAIRNVPIPTPASRRDLPCAVQRFATQPRRASRGKSDTREDGSERHGVGCSGRVGRRFSPRGRELFRESQANNCRGSEAAEPEVAPRAKQPRKSCAGVSPRWWEDHAVAIDTRSRDLPTPRRQKCPSRSVTADERSDDRREPPADSHAPTRHAESDTTRDQPTTALRADHFGSHAFWLIAIVPHLSHSNDSARRAGSRSSTSNVGVASNTRVTGVARTKSELAREA